MGGLRLCVLIRWWAWGVASPCDCLRPAPAFALRFAAKAGLGSSQAAAVGPSLSSRIACASAPSSKQHCRCILLVAAHALTEPVLSTPRRLANRLRTMLPEEERAALEQELARLAPLFDLRSTHPADGALTAKDGTPEALAGVPAATLAAVAAGHSVVEEQAAAGCERAEALAQAAADNAAQLVAAAPSVDASAAAEGAAGGGGDQQAAAGPAGAPAFAAPAAIKALAGLHADGVRSLAELCSLCLERQLALARSLSAFYRYGKPADDHISWPASCEASGLLLRAQALCMLEELRAMAAAYGAALSQAGGRRAGGRREPVAAVQFVACLDPRLGGAAVHT